MRRFVPLGLMAAFLLFMAPTLQAQEVTGDWTITYSQMGRQGGAPREVSMDVSFQMEEDALVGTALMAMGGRGGGAGGNPPAPQEVPLSDIKLVGENLTFSIERGMGDRSMTLTFSGTVAGDAMEGTMAMSGGRGGGNPIPFKGVKK